MIPIYINTVVFRTHPEDNLNILCGFLEKDNLLWLPEQSLQSDKLSSETALKMLTSIVKTDPRWLQLSFVGFFDNLGREPTRCIRLVYRSYVPQTIPVSEELKWMRHDEVAKSSSRITSDYNRIFTAAFNL